MANRKRSLETLKPRALRAPNGAIVLLTFLPLFYRQLFQF